VGFSFLPQRKWKKRRIENKGMVMRWKSRGYNWSENLLNNHGGNGGHGGIDAEKIMGL
jgi:hypothetical protein